MNSTHFKVQPGGKVRPPMNVAASTGQQADVLRVFQSKGETRAFYNKISRVYDLLSDRSEAPVREAALRLLAASKGERVLEIGFGTGHCLVALAKEVGSSGKVHGVDLSDEMLALARRNLARERLSARAELVRGDATRLPYPDHSLDAVFMCFTLELFDTPEIPRVLGECMRVLRPGGRIVVAGMTKKGAQGAIIRAFEWTHRHFPNFVDCRPIYVRQAVEGAGFKVDKALRMQMWVPTAIVLGVKPGDTGRRSGYDHRPHVRGRRRQGREGDEEVRRSVRGRGEGAGQAERRSQSGQRRKAPEVQGGERVARAGSRQRDGRTGS